MQRIAILGAGNGGAAAAAHLGCRGFDVTLWSRRAETLAPFQAIGGVAHVGAAGNGFQRVSTITTDVRTALEGTDLVLLTAPTDAHEFLAEIIAPHLVPGQIVLAAPGHTLLLIPSILRRKARPGVRFCEMGSLPYFARIQEPGKVTITKIAERMGFAAFPGHETAELASLVSVVYPILELQPTILHTVFAYLNAVLTPGVVANIGWIEATKGDFYYYYDGISPSVGRMIDSLDRERMAIGEALGADPLPIVEEFFRAGFTTQAARDTGLAYEAWHQSEPDRWIRAPATIEHRFMDEDVPYGLVPLSELGQLAGVSTPCIDAMIVVAGMARGRDYRREGLTLERMGIAGLDPPRISRLLHDGFPVE